MRNLPAKIRILGQDFLINEKEVLIRDDELCLSEIDPLNGEIKIYSDMALEQKWIYLFREIFNVIDFNEYFEEEQINKISRFFFQVLNDNGFIDVKPKTDIPKKLKILGWVYDIEEKPMIVLNDELCLGQTDFVEGKIELFEKMEIARKWITLIHEIFHAIDINDEIVEEITIYLSWVLFQILVDNGFLEVKNAHKSNKR